MSSKFSRNNIQDAYINSCRHENSEVIISLSDNKPDERGYIIAFDENTLIIRNNKCNQILIMKSSIVTIRTVKCLSIIFNNKDNSGNNSGGNCLLIRYESPLGTNLDSKNSNTPNKDNYNIKLKDAYKENINEYSSYFNCMHHNHIGEKD